MEGLDLLDYYHHQLTSLIIIVVINLVNIIISNLHKNCNIIMFFRHVFCGDYIFSGHTMTLVRFNFFMSKEKLRSILS